MAVQQRADIGNVFVVSATVDPASAAAGLSTQTFTITLDATSIGTGAFLGFLSTDIIIAIPPATLNTGLFVKRATYVAQNQVSVTFDNNTAGALDAASATWVFLVFRR